VNAVALIRNRITAVNATVRALTEELVGIELMWPVLPGTSPLGLTMWHLPRTQDWLINTCIRVRPEIADDVAPIGLPDPQRFGFGTGLSAAEARHAARAVDLHALRDYADAVAADALDWLDTLSDADLDEVPDFAKRQYSRPAYCTPGALYEVAGLDGQPVGVLLLRPAISHIFVHVGEIELLAQLATT
jgi:hypothetical protein